MNKLIALLLIGLLLLPGIFALTEEGTTGKRHTIAFTELQPQFFTLPIGDILTFTFPTRVYTQPKLVNSTAEEIEYHTEEQQHAIKIEDLGTTPDGKKAVQFAVFIHDSPYPYFPTLTKGDSLQLDFEFDELQDLVVQVLDIDKEKGISMLLIPQDISGKTPKPHVFNGGEAMPDITGGENQNTTWYQKLTNSNIKWHYLIIAAILVIILLIINRNSIRKYFVHKRNKKFKQ